MPLSSAEKQRRFRKKLRQDTRRKIEVVVDQDSYLIFKALIRELNCTQGAVIERLLLERWEEMQTDNPELEL